MLLKLREGQRDDFVGILSSHPAAILATIRACGRSTVGFSLETAKQHARDVMASCPVDYVQAAKLRGQIFEHDARKGVICCADTAFSVDHQEPMEVLAIVEAEGRSLAFGRFT